MSRVSGSVYDHGSRIALAPLSGGFSLPCPDSLCQTHQIRSRLAWCIQKSGSAGESLTSDIEPPTQMWTPPWTAFMFAAKSSKSSIARIDGTFDAIAAKSLVALGARVTWIVRVGVTTVGVTPASQPGTDSSP